MVIVRPPNSLTWMHISDLHFGHGRAAEMRFDHGAVTQAIIRDVHLVAEELGAPDFVFVTGDIAFSGSEYDAAGKWIDALLAALKVGRKQVFLVPGNHDANRRRAFERLGKSSYKGYRAEPTLVNEAFEKAEDMEALWPKLADYQEFSRHYGNPEISPTTPFWSVTRDTRLGRVVVMGLNTTLLCFDDTDSPQTLAMGLGQITRAMATHGTDDLHLVLQHHPPHWLIDGEDLRSLLRQRPHVLFCGHVHEQRGFVHLPITNRGGIELVAGAGHKEASETGEHAYAWGILHSAGLDYIPRAWSTRDKRFLHQRIDPAEEEKQWTRKLGEYARFPPTKFPSPLNHWLRARSNRIGTIPSTDTIHGPALLKAGPPGSPPSAASAPTTPGGVLQMPRAPYAEAWYVRRDKIEKKALQFLTSVGTPLILWGPELIGKTWVLKHVLDIVRQRGGYRLVEIDLREIWYQNQPLDALLEGIALAIARDLRVGRKEIAEEWRKREPSTMKLTSLMEERFLTTAKEPLIMAIDTADVVQDAGQRASLAALLRSWADRSGRPPWSQLRIAVVASTKAITGSQDQSVFHGLNDPVEIGDFNVSQVEELAHLHGLDRAPAEIRALMHVVGGHPYLARVAMFEAAHSSTRLEELLAPPMLVFEPHLQNCRAELKGFADALRRVHGLTTEHSAPLTSALAEALLRLGVILPYGRGKYRLRYRIYERL